jgi:propionyl-CoA synthetase
MDCDPSLIVCGSCGLEPNKIVDYKGLLDEALKISGYDNLTTLVVQRE